MVTTAHSPITPAPALVDADLWTKIRQRYTQYWERDSGLWRQSTFLGVPIEKFPTDAWMYQELIARLRPDVLIETGTLAGGSAYFFARLMDLIGHGEVLSIDVNLWPVPGFDHLGRGSRPKHPRVDYLHGSSTDHSLIEYVRECCDGAERVMVVLDSDHSYSHVKKELELYAPLVTPGSYLVVEDTGLNEQTNPGQGHAFGAAQALAEWLPNHPEFEVDQGCERFLITAHPGGWLRRRQT